MLKKVILFATGPGAILVLGVSLFIHLFTEKNTMVWVIASVIIFFVVFLPLYTIENRKVQDKRMKEDSD